jgi:hypothetical protein
MALDMSTTNNYNIKATSLTVSAAPNPGYSILFAYDNTITVTNWTWTTSGFNPRCFTTPTNCSSAQTVIFTGTGTMIAKNNIDAGDFWKVTISAGAVTTFTKETVVFDTMTVSGTLKAQTRCCVLATSVLAVRGYSGADPIITLNVGADMSQSGFIYYYMAGASTTRSLWTVAGGTYEGVELYGMPAGKTVQLGGNITTVSCGVTLGCELLIAGATATFNTNNYNITLGGELFIGDSPFDGPTFNAGSSTITTYEVGIAEGSIVNAQTSTWNAHPAWAYNPVAFLIGEHGATWNGGSSTINVHGSFVLWPSSGYVENFNAQAGTINLFTDEGLSNQCQEYSPRFCTSPGDVYVWQVQAYINFGTSTWNVPGQWTNRSTSASWSYGTTATINFTGSGTITSSTGLVTGEFPALVFKLGSSYAQKNDLKAKSITINGSVQFLQGGATAAGFTLSTTAGYMTIGEFTSFTNNPSQVIITFILSDSVATAQVTVTIRDLLRFSRIYVDGSGAGYIQPGQDGIISSSWSTHAVTILNSYQPTGAAPIVSMTCTKQYVLFGIRLTCSTTDSAPQNYYWYLDGKFEGTGAGFTDYVWIPFGLSRTVTISVLYMALQPIGSQAVVLDASPNFLVWMAFATITVILGVVAKRPRDDEGLTAEERVLMKQEREFDDAVLHSRR